MTGPKIDPAPPEPASPNDDTLRAKVLSLRPREHVEAERLENVIAEAMFGVSSHPTRIDRFIILGRLGAGGMGVVYSAYDPRLDRRVALKLLRDSNRVGHVERERLLREAHALARISHPNVVTVHEVGELDDQVFVVMEFVVGQNLDQWAKAAPRSATKVLEVYGQAGRGLAAVHAAGLVHRDFKPHNAVMGDDGRVRVVDFGLARGELSTDPVDEGASSTAPNLAALSTHQLAAVLTRPDALVGTPAYMSPEQYAGQRVGPASDQFSFCVSLYQALTDEHPFAASTPVEQATRIIEGDLRELRLRTGLRPPAWMLAAVRRGMSVHPQDRFGSMDELLAALARDPARTRRRWLAGAAVGALVGLSGYAMLRRPTAELPCQGSTTALAEVWNDTRRETLRERFSTLGSSPDADLVGSRVIDALDAYAERWRSMHQDACLAHHRGEQSGVLLDKRMACLARRRAALDSGFEVLSTADATTFENAAFLVHDLPPVHMCGDLEVLEAELPVPEDPKVANEVASIRDGLTSALLFAKGGRVEQANERVAAEDARARRLGYPPVLAEVLLVRGRIEMVHELRDASRIAATLLEAFHAGVAARSDAVAAEALVRRLYIEAIRPGGQPVREEDYGLVQAFLARLPDPSYVQGLFLNNAGSIAASHGDFEAARSYLRQSLAVKQSAPEPNPIEVLETRFNLALMSKDPTSHIAGLELAAEGFERELGSTHPRTLDSKLVLARATRDLLVAEERFGSLCGAYQEFHPEYLDRISSCVFDEGTRAAELGDRERAAATFERVADMLRSDFPMPSLRLRQTLAQANALRYRGHAAAAIAVLEPPLKEIEQSELPAWFEQAVRDAHLTLGEILAEADRPLDAVAELRPAIRSLTERNAQRVDNFAGHELAGARLVLAGALLDAPLRSPSVIEETSQLLDSAADWYRGSGPGSTWRLDEIERVRRRSHGP